MDWHSISATETAEKLKTNIEKGLSESEAKKRLGAKSVDSVRSKISGYGKSSNAEAVAEAFADVYCNGKKASKESQTVVNILSEYLRR